MKKSTFLIFPFLTISFLASCNNAKEKFSVTFETNGAIEHIPLQKVTAGNCAVKPNDPVRGDDTFLGWYNNVDLEGDEYTFTTPVINDLTLYAKWQPAPSVCHFKFIGKDCSINGKSAYEVDFSRGTSAQLRIKAHKDYLPVNDNDSFKVISGQKYVSYDDIEGIISINNIASDIVIEAKPHPGYAFEFSGTNCKINGNAKVRIDKIQKGSKLQYTLLPDDGFVLPTKKEDVIISGQATYLDGIITINGIAGEVTITANAPVENSYNICFNGRNCKAGLSPYDTAASYSFTTTRLDSEDSITLYLFPDFSFSLPNRIVPLFEGSECEEGDYVYDKENRTITIYKKANTIIKDASTANLITFDAGEGGTYPKREVFQIEVENDIYISNLFSLVPIPTKENKIFGYYTYSDGSDVNYSDVITSDITLKANYLDSDLPLENVSWDVIKRIAVTGYPASIFSIGETKKIQILNEYTVRIIGFNHDKVSSVESIIYAGITFELVEIFSDNVHKDAVKVNWDNNNNYDFPLSNLNVYLLADVYRNVADSVIPYITSVEKKVGVSESKKPGPENFKAISYDTYFFPLAYSEVMDVVDPDVTPGEGTIYEYYKSHSLEKKLDLKGNPQDYWLRSPSTQIGAYANMAWIFSVHSEKFIQGSIFGTDIFDGGVASAFCI